MLKKFLRKKSTSAPYNLSQWAKDRVDYIPLLFRENKYRMPHIEKIIKGSRHLVIPIRPQPTDVINKPNVTTDMLKMNEKLERLINTKCYAEWDQSYVYYFIQMPEKFWTTLTFSDLSNNEIGKTEYKHGIEFDINRTYPHTIVAGSTGSGKSVTLETIALRLLKTHSPDDMEVIIIDPHLHLGERDNAVLGSFNNLAHMRYVNRVLSKPEECNAAIEYLNGILNARRNGESGRRIVTIIDEATTPFLQQSMEYLETLTAEGNKYKLNFILGANKPDKLSSDLTFNLQQKLVGMVDNNNVGTRILGTPGIKFHNLLGKGDFIIKNNSTHRFQCATPEAKDFDKLERGSHIDRSTTVIKSEPIKKPGRPHLEINPAALMHYLYFDPRTISEKNSLKLFGLKRRGHEIHRDTAMQMGVTWKQLKKRGIKRLEDLT